MRYVKEIDFPVLRKSGKFHASPQSWEDQVLYFLLLDRFSDGKEKGCKGNNGKPVAGGTTLPYNPASDNGNAVSTPGDAAEWRDAGGKWAGGTLKGLTARIGYLKRLGMTALWVSPVFKQAAFQPGSYHGYGIQ